MILSITFQTPSVKVDMLDLAALCYQTEHGPRPFILYNVHDHISLADLISSTKAPA